MSAAASIWALVPAKCFGSAKSRLAGVLDDAERAALARSMLEHVLATLAASTRVEATAVVTDCDEVEAVARARGAVVLRDAASPPLGAIVDGALASLAARGAGRVLVLMSDLPHVGPRDVDALVAAPASVVVAPDERRLGTNALVVDVPARAPTCFGRTDSFAAHLASAEAVGLRAAVHASPSLAFDVDTEDDLATLAGGRDARGG